MDRELVPLLPAGTVVCGSMVVMQLLLRIDIKGSRRKKTNVRNGREAPTCFGVHVRDGFEPPGGSGGLCWEGGRGSSGQGPAGGLCLQWLDGASVSPAAAAEAASGTS